MRKRRGRTGGVSLGTAVSLVLTVLVLGGCIYLLPKLVGHIELRVDAQRIGVALDDALRGVQGSPEAVGNPEAISSLAPGTTPATAPPMAVSTYAPTQAQPELRTLTLTATGSISVDAQVQKACTGADGYAFGPLFENLAGGFQSDINLATLENLVILNEKLTDINMPVDALTAIGGSGVNTLCTGFYAALNYGLSGLNETLDAIAKSGLTAYGVYASAESREHVVTLATGETTVALLSFQSDLSAAGKKRTTTEEQDFVIAPLTLPTIAADITKARAAGAQIVIVSLCWGKEGASAPSDIQKQMAQSIAAAGADVILGTHSGALQPIEILTAKRADGSTHQTLCAYSLGNLLESDRSERESISGILLHVQMEYDLAADALSFRSLTYTPTYVWRGRIDGRNTYRVLRSNAEPPDYVDGEQRKVMERCLKLVRDVLEGSPVTEAP